MESNPKYYNLYYYLPAFANVKNVQVCSIDINYFTTGVFFCFVFACSAAHGRAALIAQIA